MLDHVLKRILRGFLRTITAVDRRRKSDPIVVLDGVVRSSPLPVITFQCSDFHTVLRSLTRGLRQRLSVKRHESVRRELGVPGNVLPEFLDLCANSRIAKIEREKFQSAALADVVA